MSPIDGDASAAFKLAMMWTTIYYCYTFTITARWEDHTMGMLPGVYPLAIYIVDGGKLTRYRWFQTRIEKAGHSTDIRWIFIGLFCIAALTYWVLYHPPEPWIMSVFTSLLAVSSYTSGSR